MANKSWQVMLAEATSLVFLIPISTVVGYAIGWALDKAFGTHWLYIAFLILGAVAGFIQLLRQLTRDMRNDAE